MLILFLSFYDSCCVLYHENCTPEFYGSVYLIMVFFIVEDEIFQLNVSFILIYGCFFFVQIIIYVTFIRNREFVFQIITFLCLHELYMAYAWSKWSRLKLFPSNWINHTFGFKGTYGIICRASVKVILHGPHKIPFLKDVHSHLILVCLILHINRTFWWMCAVTLN